MVVYVEAEIIVLCGVVYKVKTVVPAQSTVEVHMRV